MPPFQTHPSGTQHSLFREAANWLRPIPKVNFSKDTPRVAIWRQHFKTKNKGHVEGIIGYEYLGYLFFLSTLKLKESWLGIFPPENKGHGNQASSDSTIDHTNHLLGFKNHLLGFNKKNTWEDMRRRQLFFFGADDWYKKSSFAGISAHKANSLPWSLKHSINGRLSWLCTFKH